MNTRLLSLAYLAFISSAYDTPETCTTASIAAWYDGGSFTGATWDDKSGTVAPGAASYATLYPGDGTNSELELNGQPVVYGGTDAAVLFNTNLPQAHTVFNLCKYRAAGSRGRIIDGKNCNCLFGHWDGYAGVAHEDRWMTPVTQGTQAGDPEGAQAGNPTNWLLSSQTNSQYRANGINRQTTTGIAGAIGTIGIHTGMHAGETSAWACAEVLAYNEALATSDIECIEQYFSYKYGVAVAGVVYNPCVGVDCGGECGSCDAQTGACVYDDGVCNDNDLCNGEETCDTGTGTCVEGTALECADGDPCNGEEYCDSETGCMPGTDLTCPNGFICTEDVGCERNCDLFAIDGYLEECSVVMSDSQQELVDLEETLTAANEAQDAVIANAEVDIAALQGEDDAIYAILGEWSTVEEGAKENVYAQLEAQDAVIANAEDNIDALQAECDVITARLDAFAPLAEMGEQTGQMGQGIIDVPQLGGVGQNNLIILLLISNMVLVVALIAVVCWYRTVRYKTVKYYSAAADEENVQLNK